MGKATFLCEMFWGHGDFAFGKVSHSTCINSSIFTCRRVSSVSNKIVKAVYSYILCFSERYILNRQLNQARATIMARNNAGSLECFSNKDRVYKISEHQASLWLRQSRSLGSALSSSSEPLLGSRPAKGYFHMSSSARAWVLCSTVPSPRSTVLLNVSLAILSSHEHVYRTHYSDLSHLEYALYHFYFRADFVLITVDARLDAVCWRWARRGEGVGNVHCRDGLPGLAGLVCLAL